MLSFDADIERMSQSGDGSVSSIVERAFISAAAGTALVTGPYGSSPPAPPRGRILAPCPVRTQLHRVPAGRSRKIDYSPPPKAAFKQTLVNSSQATDFALPLTQNRFCSDGK